MHIATSLQQWGGHLSEFHTKFTAHQIIHNFVYFAPKIKMRHPFCTDRTVGVAVVTKILAHSTTV